MRIIGLTPGIPCSGLETTCAQAVMTSLRRLATEGMGILTVLHSPSSSVFFSADHIILLAHGCVVCQGAPGEMESWLDRAGLSCPPGASVPDHLLCQCSKPEKAAMLREAGGRGGRGLADAAIATDKAAPARKLASWLTELRLLAWRETLFHVRSRGPVLTHTFLALLLGVWMGLVYLHLGRDIQAVQNRAGLLFFSVCSFGFGALSAAESFISQRALVSRERYRLYSPLSHFVVRLALDFLLLRLVPVTIYASILYPMAGLHESHFGIFYVSLALLATAASGWLPQ